MAEVSSEFETLFFKKNTDKFEIEKKSCKIIHSDDKTVAYSFENDNKIWVYYVDKDGEDTKGNPIIDGDQLVKLTVKNSSSDKFMYVDFINTHVAKKEVVSLELGKIIRIIKSITTIYGIHKIMLQDDAHFYLSNSENAVKALHLRALQKTKDELSIYQNHKFKPTKEDNIESCLETLRKISCLQLKQSCQQILNSLININYSTTSVYQINVQHTNLEVSYIPIKAHKLRLGPIFNRYRENLNKLLSLFTEDKDSNQKIYEFCKINKKSEEKDYKKSHNFLSCLENDVNMNVIIVEGEAEDSKTSSDHTDCDFNKTVETVTKNPINITKIFNLFYGTFKKIDYLYNEMVLDIS